MTTKALALTDSTLLSISAMDATTRNRLIRFAGQRADPLAPSRIERGIATLDARGGPRGRPTDEVVNEATGEALTLYQLGGLRVEALRVLRAMRLREKRLRGAGRLGLDLEQQERLGDGLRDMRRLWASWLELFEEFGIRVEEQPDSDIRLVLRDGYAFSGSGVPQLQGRRR